MMEISKNGFPPSKESNCFFFWLFGIPGWWGSDVDFRQKCPPGKYSVIGAQIIGPIPCAFTGNPSEVIAPFVSGLISEYSEI
jgi:hypothetical protein